MVNGYPQKRKATKKALVALPTNKIVFPRIFRGNLGADSKEFMDRMDKRYTMYERNGSKLNVLEGICIIARAF